MAAEPCAPRHLPGSAPSPPAATGPGVSQYAGFSLCAAPHRPPATPPAKPACGPRASPINTPQGALGQACSPRRPRIFARALAPVLTSQHCISGATAPQLIAARRSMRASLPRPAAHILSARSPLAFPHFIGAVSICCSSSTADRMCACAHNKDQPRGPAPMSGGRGDTGPPSRTDRCPCCPAQDCCSAPIISPPRACCARAPSRDVAGRSRAAGAPCRRELDSTKRACLFPATPRPLGYPAACPSPINGPRTLCNGPARPGATLVRPRRAPPLARNLATTPSPLAPYTPGHATLCVAQRPRQARHPLPCA